MVDLEVQLGPWLANYWSIFHRKLTRGAHTESVIWWCSLAQVKKEMTGESDRAVQRSNRRDKEIKCFSHTCAQKKREESDSTRDAALQNLNQSLCASLCISNNPQRSKVIKPDKQSPGCGRADLTVQPLLKELQWWNCIWTKCAVLRHRQMSFCFYGDAKLNEGNLREVLGVY